MSSSKVTRNIALSGVFSMLASPIMAQDTYVFNPYADNFTGGQFMQSLEKLDKICELSDEDYIMVSMCEEIGEIVWDEDDICLDISDGIPLEPNNCQENVLKNWTGRMHAVFNEVFMNGGQPCENNSNMACFNVKGETFIFPFQPA